MAFVCFSFLFVNITVAAVGQGIHQVISVLAATSSYPGIGLLGVHFLFVENSSKIIYLQFNMHIYVDRPERDYFSGQNQNWFSQKRHIPPDVNWSLSYF